jgi:DNA-binding transcriptional regulator YhcF (GntR family)
MELTIDRDGPLPLREQLTGQIRLLIDNGELEPGESLPTIKDASDRLGVNANTVAAAYRSLEQEGYLTQRRRAGTTVAAAPPRGLERALAGLLAADVAERARAAGVASADLLSAVAAHGAAPSAAPQLRVAVLAEDEGRARELARRTGAALGARVECVPLVPSDYVSVDYHLTIVDPALTDRLSQPQAGRGAAGLPAYLAYSPEFPAAAD